MKVSRLPQQMNWTGRELGDSDSKYMKNEEQKRNKILIKCYKV